MFLNPSPPLWPLVPLLPLVSLITGSKSTTNIQADNYFRPRDLPKETQIIYPNGALQMLDSFTMKLSN